MSKYHIWTIGCQMNKAESSRLSSLFESMGYLPTGAVKDADLVVLNSCMVRQSAESRVINKLHALRSLKRAKPGMTIAVTGCLVDSTVDQLEKSFPQVDYFFKPGAVPPWIEGIGAVSEALQKPAPGVFVPVIQGCNNFCSYCIVPYRRGREISRPVAEIVCEVKKLVCSGVKEVTLLGQNVDSYGHDLPDRPDLAGLLAELNDVDGLARIRFLTNHPKDMNQRLIEAIARLDKVCEQISLPVQSGSNDILKVMRRGYTVEQYRQLVNQIREKVPGVALSTDVIVGFPSESDGQFQQTYDLLSDIKFDTVHVAAYSPRPGTAASKEFEDNIPSSEKKARLNRIEQLQERMATEINARLLGETVEILVDGKVKDKWQGRTCTDKLVFFSDRNDWMGRLVRVRIDMTSPWSLQGELVLKQGGEE